MQAADEQSQSMIDSTPLFSPPRPEENYFAFLFKAWPRLTWLVFASFTSHFPRGYHMRSNTWPYKDGLPAPSYTSVSHPVPRAEPCTYWAERLSLARDDTGGRKEKYLVHPSAKQVREEILDFLNPVVIKTSLYTMNNEEVWGNICQSCCHISLREPEVWRAEKWAGTQ